MFAVEKSTSTAALRHSLLIGVIVFVACLVGILSRLPGTLAVFWPTNALLLGLLVRAPRLATVPMWVCAVGGYLAADLVTGASFESALWLGASNMIGVVGGFYAFRWVGMEDRQLSSIRSVVYLVSMTMVAAAITGCVGGAANVVLFGGTWSAGWILWFSGNLVNYMTIVPLVLTFPSLRQEDRDPEASARILGLSVIPAVLLGVCILLEWVIGGAGAIAFAMPALVTAALLTNVFVTSLMTAISTVCTLVLTADGHLGTAVEGLSAVSASVRIGLALLATAPIAVACVIYERRRALDALTEAVMLDDLTGALRRDEFMRKSTDAIESLQSGLPVSVLMMDLDHFKKVNDTLGHRTGDTVLVAFADQVRRHLDHTALFARLGGEEFVVLLIDTDLDEATRTAEIIREAQQEQSMTTLGELGPTVSIGVACSPNGDADVAGMIDCADEALYLAKKFDRNCTVSLTARS
ncbi:diguanylate cyclase [Rhodococcus sp. KBS0724]|uniref:GGDEF domain-containing protein n=1 Tax=Rhodococcus sp. KBS0724 TaxID=1179674 RepID=UPI00110F663C|nr:sensor domain-containing diguanylate cyclase [Rhodococcus sp. KBS0724]TSD47803.1 diguanylate cyclase [Rhodococcus sp. KBS0724]